MQLDPFAIRLCSGARGTEKKRFLKQDIAILPFQLYTDLVLSPGAKASEGPGLQGAPGELKSRMFTFQVFSGFCLLVYALVWFMLLLLSSSVRPYFKPVFCSLQLFAPACFGGFGCGFVCSGLSGFLPVDMSASYNIFRLQHVSFCWLHQPSVSFHFCFFVNVLHRKRNHMLDLANTHEEFNNCLSLDLLYLSSGT